MFTIEELKNKNKWFDFKNYEITDIHKDKFKNDCIASRDGKFHIIWIDMNGEIIKESLNISMQMIKAHENIYKLEKEIIRMKCKPIDISIGESNVHKMWCVKLTSIRQKEKGMNRLIRKIEKLYEDNLNIDKIGRCKMEIVYSWER